MGKVNEGMAAYAVRHSPIACKLCHPCTSLREALVLTRLVESDIANLHKSISDRDSIDLLLTQI